jgi:hypothetical protein
LLSLRTWLDSSEECRIYSSVFGYHLVGRADP